MLPLLGLLDPMDAESQMSWTPSNGYLVNVLQKSLRGEAMLDVIFAGSAVRKPLGAANGHVNFR